MAILGAGEGDFYIVPFYTIYEYMLLFKLKKTLG
jgi:hypothetical protein